MQEEVWKTDPEWFRPWFNSEAYHILYGHRSETEAHQLVERLCRREELSTPAKALDAGCGAGRHARALAKAGWDVTAFDLSDASISLAQSQDSSNHLTYRVLDLRELHQLEEWQEQFDLVTNFFTSLGYFRTRLEQENVLKGFAQCMMPGGWLLIDYLNVDHVRSNLIAEELLERRGMTFHIHRRVHQGWIEKSIQFEWEGEWNHHVESVQALHRKDFERLLANQGLEIHRVWGNYHLEGWSEESPRCLLLAQKPHHS